MADTINIRVTAKEKARLREIASSVDMTLSGFLRAAAMAEAERLLGYEKPALISSLPTAARHT